MWKKLGLAVILLLVIIGGSAWVLFARLDGEILAAIEANGSAASTSKVAVESVALSILSGQCVINGLTVDNPPGFTTPYAIRLGTITIHAQIASFFRSGPLLIDQVVIDKPHIFYEVTSKGGSGLSLQSLNPASTSNLAILAREARARPDTGPKRKEIIREVTVTHGEVSVATTLLQGQHLTEKLAPIRLTGIGAGSGGVTTGQAGTQVLTAITDEAALEGAASLVKAIGSAATGPLGGALADKVKSLF